jgi:hypothetical protein
MQGIGMEEGSSSSWYSEPVTPRTLSGSVSPVDSLPAPVKIKKDSF